MASLVASQPTAVNPTSPVPLDTIPISPEGGNAGTEEKKVGYTDLGPVTVFHDADNFNVKHPLMNAWTLWFTKPPTGKGDNWNELLKEVISFDSVEEFWGIYVGFGSRCAGGPKVLTLPEQYHACIGPRPEV